MATYCCLFLHVRCGLSIPLCRNIMEIRAKMKKTEYRAFLDYLNSESEKAFVSKEPHKSVLYVLENVKKRFIKTFGEKK